MAFIALLYIVIPKPKILDRYSYSSAVYDRKGKLLRLGLSLDDKYRLFVPIEEIPEKLIDSLLLYEDRSFYYHFGVSPFSIVRASFAMVSGGRVQGASTITMQLARILYNIDSKTIFGKINQALRAIQIEMFYSKKEILEGYFNLAPYGGNIEGVGAASIIYFNNRAQSLNLQQSIALAVIPQNPNKRNLAKKSGIEEVEEASLRLKELWFEKYGEEERANLSLPLYANKYLPNHAPHFVRLVQNQKSGEVFSTLDLNKQNKIEDIMKKYIKANNSKGFENATAILVDNETMDIVSYIGSIDFFNNEIQGQVDGLQAYRSPGSAMKPFIYALAMETGQIHPMSMLKDIPKNYSFYTPENFDRAFMGLVSATDSLINSRNIPVLDLLGALPEDKFYNILKDMEIRRMKTSKHYGLGLALGAFELRPVDVAQGFAMLANYGAFCKVNYYQKDSKTCVSKQLISKEASFLAVDMLSKNTEIDRRQSKFSKNNKKYNISWKTGTSYGYRDAWTAGVFGKYTLVVWVGNFDNTSNNYFLGRRAAAPLFFQIVRAIAQDEPMDNMSNFGLNLTKIDICNDTGDIDNGYCPKTTKSYFIPGVSHIKPSNITRLIPIDVKTGKRACRHTPPTTKLEAHNFWPTSVLKVFSMAGMGLKTPPAFLEDCSEIDIFDKGKPPTIHYPTNGAVYILRSNEIEQERIILKASLDADATTIFWYADNKLLGQVKADEAIEYKPEIGNIEIMATDNLGRSSVSKIQIKLVD